MLFNYIDAYFKGLRRINKYVLFIAISSFINILVNVPLIYFLGIYGAVLSFVFLSILNTSIGIMILKRIKLIPNLKKTIKVERNVISNIYKVGLGSVLALVMQQLTFLFVRSNIAGELSLASVGIFQSVYAISINYFGIFFVLLATYSIPKFSTFKTKHENNQELNTTLKFLLILYTPLILTIFVFRTFVITILYSEEFLIAKDLLVYQLSGDFFRALSWLFGLWLLPNLKIKQWILFDFVFYVLFYSLFYIFLNYSTFGIKSVSIAYLIAYISHFIINFLYTKFSIDFKYMNKNLKNLFISSIVLALALFVSEYNEIYGYIIIIPLIVVWTFFVIKKRDFLNLKEILLSKLKK